MTRALLIGYEDCEYSQKAYNFLKICDFDVTCFWAERQRGSKIPDEIKLWRGDYIFHLKSYCILPKSLISRASAGAINFHPSCPKYPGAGCVNWTLYNNEKTTAITVHHMNEKVDSGKIIKVYDIPLYRNDTVASVLQRIEFNQLVAFYDIVAGIVNYGKTYIDKSSRLCDRQWTGRVRKIKEIDTLENITIETPKEELEKIIRATNFMAYGPKIYIHGYKFKFAGEEK